MSEEKDGAYPVIEFYDDMISCFVGAKLHIHYPIHS